MIARKWHVERAKVVKGIDEIYYDAKSDFNSYEEANDYFMNLEPVKGERAYLEYSDMYQACILGVRSF